MTDAPLVTVRWEDCQSHNGWSSLDDACKAEPAEVVSVGWLIRKDKKVLTVAHGRSVDEVLGYTVIPMSWVNDIREVT